MGLPCTIFDGERMERKRRRRGNSPMAWKGGREAGRGDRRGASGGGRCFGGPSVRRCARVRWSGGEVREIQEMVPHLYRVGWKGTAGGGGVGARPAGH
jgi:hypothetical protein